MHGATIKTFSSFFSFKDILFTLLVTLGVNLKLLPRTEDYLIHTTPKFILEGTVQ